MSGRGERTGIEKANNDNKSDQCNPNNSKYGGYDGGYKGDGTQAALNNHADQLNPNNKKYQGPTPKGQ